MGFSAECRVSFSSLTSSCPSEIVSRTALAVALNGTWSYQLLCQPVQKCGV